LVGATEMKFLTRIGDWLAFPYCAFLMLKEPRASWRVKLKAGAILAVVFLYLLVPLDLIPDIAPVIGWLDDLLVLPLATAVTRKVIPEFDVSSLIKKARSDTGRVVTWVVWMAAAMVVIGVSTIVLLVYLAIRNWPVT
jgi:uncharacterized membrane protein YkvA (DUF1232 family)